MKAAKLRKSNKKEDNKKVIENEFSIKKMIITTVIIVVIFLIFYFITSLVVKPIKETNKDNTVTEIDSTKITLSNLLNRKESEYYVLAIKESMYENSYSDISYTEIYDNYILDYSKNESALTFYRVDLDDALNKNFISEELNISNELSSLKINDEVLFKVKNGEIKNYYVGNSNIVKALANLK